MIWEELKPTLIFTHIEAETEKDIFHVLGSALVDAGYAKTSYVQALAQREQEYPTGLNMGSFGIAIPHTEAGHVNQPAIALATLKHPVRFIEMGSIDTPVDVRIVCMLAIAEPHAHIEQLQAIITILQDQELLSRIYGETDPQEIIDLVRVKEEGVVI